jgi:hypothetical protein
MSATTDIDALFQLPLGEFTEARNKLAAQLKKDRKTEDAARVRTLSKPPVSAWVVNQLYWRHRQAFERLLASGDRFRKAQAAQLAGKASNLQATLEARREALAELAKLAARILRDSDHPLSPDMQRRITTTLEALSTHGSHPDAPTAGRLTDDVDPPGFEALASLVPQPGGSAHPKTSKVLPFKTQGKGHKKQKEEKTQDAKRQRQAARREAARAVHAAERALKAARKAAERAEAALKQAAARAKSAEATKERVQKQLDKVAAVADETRQAARKVAARAEDAAQVVADAERGLEHARQALDALR